MFRVLLLFGCHIIFRLFLFVFLSFCVIDSFFSREFFSMGNLLVLKVSGQQHSLVQVSSGVLFRGKRWKFLIVSSHGALEDAYVLLENHTFSLSKYSNSTLVTFRNQSFPVWHLIFLVYVASDRRDRANFSKIRLLKLLKGRRGSLILKVCWNLGKATQE